ncbi:hypothetical protein JCM10213_002204 [Rhodosporidiobolus nylandii]
MYSLRAASRALAPTSQTSLPRVLARALSTEPNEQQAQQSTNTHLSQRAARPRSLKQVTEEGGATAKLVAIAVQNTAKTEPAVQALGQRGGRPYKPRQQAGEGEQGRSSAPRPRRQRETAAVDAALLEGVEGEAPVQRAKETRGPRRERPQQGSSGLGAALSSRRSNVSDAARELLDRASLSYRPPRPAGGPRGAPRKPRGPARPKQPRAPRPSLAANTFSAEDTKPLTLPTSVRVPTANIAQLLRADLAAKALQVKAAVGQGVDENAAKQGDRERARRVLGGDYSLWTEAGSQVAKGAKGHALEHARGVLALNPSVGISGREALLNKVKEAL